MSAQNARPDLRTFNITVRVSRAFMKTQPAINQILRIHKKEVKVDRDIFFASFIAAINKKTFLLLFSTMAICMLNSGCMNAFVVDWYRSHRLAPEGIDSQAKKMAAPPDNALVYYYGYGDYWYIFERNHRLYLDNKCVAGRIWPPGFYVWLLPPGSHTFEINGSKISFNATGGETYFIQQNEKNIFNNFDLKTVDKETGRKHINESQMLILNTEDECGSDITPSEADMQMKSLKPPGDKALVYLYRDTYKYEAPTATIYLDDNASVEIAAGTFLLWQLASGAHTFKSDRGNVIIEAKTGETYYLRLKSIHGAFGSWHYSLQLVDKEEGCKGLENKTLMLGSSEANFELASEARLPKWFKLPAGLSRTDVTVTMDYYIPPWGRIAVFIMLDKQGHKLAKVTGKQKDYSPNELKNPLLGFPSGYPSYEIITVDGVTDIIEHRKMEPIFYVTDDPNIWKELGVAQTAK